MDISGELLRSSFQNIRSGAIKAAELGKMVQLARSVCSAHLQYMRGSVLRLALHQGLTVNDLAYDCIAEAFARNSENRFPRIQSFLDSLHSPVETIPDIELVLAFKGFVTKIADVQLARLYAQADPAGARIFRNIRECLKIDSRFCLSRDFRGLVFSPAQCDRLDEREAFPLDELERLFRVRVHREQDVPQLLKIVGEILRDQSAYRRSVPLADATQLLKKLYLDRTDALDDLGESINTDDLSESEIEAIHAEVQVALKEKILLSYLARGKLDRKQAEAMFNALNEMMRNWYKGDGAASGLYDCLRHYMTIDHATYESTLRTKMEYLVKIARQEFTARLMREI